MSTVAVCDTEPIAIEGLRCLLEAEPGVHLVASDTLVEQAIENLQHLRPSVLVIDRGFGAHMVMECLRLVRAAQIPTAVIVWGMLNDTEALRYVQSGAAGVIRKCAPIMDILTCLRTVMGGGTWMEYGLLPSMDLVVRNGRSALTARETQVMQLVEQGLKNKEIAQNLGIQTGTVKIHLKHIFEKTGIRGRYGLALNGLKQKGYPSLLAS